ncbi:hypothetical protein C2869_17475 [Saccharobesus litoralis]|uniref:DUF4340 domain-containing protein n=1 Tax=Saccharobesus litoralis TaxID=2172099 RepID=A0A2S0VVA4_9ALTE|nr:DUF4340 domain-containing protein [Saccharobesus litoralis]AWB68102.1 hypothetical protein C2869_17475 [Saccharobesus litoralis]
MNKNIVLLLVGVLVAVVAAVVSQSGKPDSSAQQQTLLSDFDVNQLQQVKFIKAGDQLVLDAEKQGDKWQVNNLDGYPLNVADLSKFVQELVDSKLVEKKTANASKHARLGLTAINDSDSEATLLHLVSEGKSIDLLLGNFAKGNGRYVRFADQDQTWLIDKQLYTPSSAANWIDKKLFNDFTMADIKRLELAGEEGFVLNKADKEQADFNLESVPSERTAKSSSELASLSSSIGGLRMDAPRLLDSQLWQNDSVKSLKVSLFNGVDYQLKLVNSTDADSDENWLSVVASGTDEASNVIAQQYNDNYGKWQYALPSYTFDSLDKSIEDMLEPLAETSE